MKVTAIIVCAGSSARMGFDKIFHIIDGKTVLERSIEAFEKAGTVDDIIVAVRKESVAYVQNQYGQLGNLTVVSGGNTRAESVINGINAIEHTDGIIAVHDGARPFVTPKLIDKVIIAAFRNKAVIPAVRVKDTIKKVENGTVVTTPDRAKLYAAQTPQAFDLRTYRELLQNQNGYENITDDSILFEQAGIPVMTVEGDYSNIKITTKEDL